MNKELELTEFLLGVTGREDEIRVVVEEWAKEKKLTCSVHKTQNDFTINVSTGMTEAPEALKADLESVLADADVTAYVVDFKLNVTVSRRESP